MAVYERDNQRFPHRNTPEVHLWKKQQQQQQQHEIRTLISMTVSLK